MPAPASIEFTDSPLDLRSKTGETVYERRDAADRAAGVTGIARQNAGVVVRKRNYLLCPHKASRKRRRTPAPGYQDEIHLRKAGEVVQQRSGSKCATAVQRPGRFRREHQNFHVASVVSQGAAEAGPGVSTLLSTYAISCSSLL